MAPELEVRDAAYQALYLINNQLGVKIKPAPLAYHIELWRLQ